MILTSDGYGKTAPRLLFDVFYHFPQLEPVTQSRLTLPWDALDAADADADQLRPALGLPAKHSFFVKTAQSALPDANKAVSIGPSSRFLASTICHATRFHFEFRLDFAGRPHDGFVLPCGRPSGGLTHHFEHLTSALRAGRAETPDQHVPESLDHRWEAQHVFRCSRDPCRATLTITIREPVISNLTLDHLCSPDKIARRRAEAEAEGIENVPVLAPINVLRNLLVYVTNALSDDFSTTSFHYLNKVFWAMFGSDNIPFLSYIGFERESDGAAGFSRWHTPQPGKDRDQWRPHDRRSVLEDLQEELSCLISQRPLAEHDGGIRSVQGVPPSYPAGQVLSDLFGCGAYSRVSRFLWDEQKPVKLHADLYDRLGVLPDYDNTLLVYAFECQTESRPERTKDCLDALESFARLRNSEELYTKAALVASSFTVSATESGYKSLGVPESADDDTVLAAFCAAASDAPPDQESELRTQLLKIGESRSSARIIAEGALVTGINHAMEVVGISDTDTDDAVESIAVTKRLDYIEQKRPGELARLVNAVRLIADARDSTHLREWALEAEEAEASRQDGSNNPTEETAIVKFELSVPDAYRAFSITNTTEYVDEEMLSLTKENFLAEFPDEIDRISLAYEKILEHNRQLFPNGPQAPESDPEAAGEMDAARWPVGLDNIGNTCYLNSILQYLFTVKDLRDLVLHFDPDTAPIDERCASDERLAKQLDRARSFVSELRLLFEQMITSEKRVVQPGRELAMLAFSRDPDTHPNPEPERMAAVEADADQSGIVESIEKDGPAIAADDGAETSDIAIDISIEQDTETVAVGGRRPESAKRESSDPASAEAEESRKRHRGSVSTAPGTPDDSQNSILRTDSVDELSQAESFQAGGPHSDHIDISLDMTPPGSPEDDERMASSPRAQEQDGGTEPNVDTSLQTQLVDSSIGEEIESLQQQDVTEVLKNMLFHIMAAVSGNPEPEKDVESSLIRSLFFMKVVWTLPNAVREEIWGDVLVYLPDGPRSIYAALDAEFDPHPIDLGKETVDRYGSLKEPPLFFQVNVCRVGFDPYMNGAYKIEHQLKLVETLYLDRYLQSDSEDILERRKRAWAIKKELRELKKELLSCAPVPVQRPALPQRESNDTFIAGPEPEPFGHFQGISARPGSPGSTHAEIGDSDNEHDLESSMIPIANEDSLVEGAQPADGHDNMDDIAPKEDEPQHSTVTEGTIFVNMSESGLEDQGAAVEESGHNQSIDVDSDGVERETIASKGPGLLKDETGLMSTGEAVEINIEDDTAADDEKSAPEKNPAGSEAGSVVSEPATIPAEPAEDVRELNLARAARRRALVDEIRKLDDELSHLFDDLQSEPYHLFAAFMHRGVSSGGHYWILIRDLGTGEWRKYNDDIVEPASDRDVFVQPVVCPATASFLVFVKGVADDAGTQEKGNRLVETVCRRIRRVEKPVVVLDEEEPVADPATTMEETMEETVEPAKEKEEKEDQKENKESDDKMEDITVTLG